MNLNTVPVFFNLLKSCHDGARLYPAGNPLVEQPLKHFLAAYREYLNDDGKIELRIINNFVQFNGEGLPGKVLKQAGVAWFVMQCIDRHISLMVFQKGLQRNDIAALTKVLGNDSRNFTDLESAPRLLLQEGVKRIQINTTDDISDNGDLDASFNFEIGAGGVLNPIGPASNRSAPQQPRQAQPPAAQPRPAQPQPTQTRPAQMPPDDFDDPSTSIMTMDFGEAESGNDPLSLDFAPTPGAEASRQEHANGLFISSQDQNALFETIDQLIDGGNLSKVAEILTMIRRDLTAQARDDREIAFSSYQVVVSTLIGARQDRSILAILKTMGEDLLRCKEVDLFAVHLETLIKIIIFFEEAPLPRYYLEALNVLANQALRQYDERRPVVDQKVQMMLEPHKVEVLLGYRENDLREGVKKLFHQHGSGILTPLLNTLYESKDRNHRKRLLEILHIQGPLIYPRLLEELKQSIETGRPWYIKRNLLTLLSVKPPIELMALAPNLLSESSNRVVDITCRCIFTIHDQRAFAYGRKLLREADPPTLKKFLGYLHASREPAYINTLIEIVKRHEVVQIRMDALNVLGRIGGDDVLKYLVSILEKSPKGDVQKLRVGAARAMVVSRDPKALKMLIKYERDSDKELRALVQRAFTAT